MSCLKVIKSNCEICGAKCEKVMQMFYHSEKDYRKNRYFSIITIGVSCHNCEFYQEAYPIKYENLQNKLLI